MLLTHLHLDHLQGIGFFLPLFAGTGEVHVWGPPSISADLRTRLGRYLSPPLFPVRVRDLGSRIVLHDAPPTPRPRSARSPSARTSSSIPAPRWATGSARATRTIAYLPDHEPALGLDAVPTSGRWTSGYDLAADADLLLHDAQYTVDERRTRVGWGHSSIDQTVAFAELTRSRGAWCPSTTIPATTTRPSTGCTRRWPALTAIPVERGCEGATFEV